MVLDFERFSKLLICFWALLILIGCAGGNTTIRSFFRKEVDLSYIRKVAVLKFDNHSQDKFAGDRLRDLVANEILALGIFDVVDRSVVDFVLKEELGKETVNLSKSDLIRIAKRLKVQGLILGSVDDYRLANRGSFSYPVVALTLRLVDGKTGEIIWSSSGTKTGYSFWGRLFGFKPKDIMEISFDLVRGMLRKLR